MVGDSGERGSIHDFGDLNIEVVGTPGGVIHLFSPKYRDSILKLLAAWL